MILLAENCTPILVYLFRFSELWARMGQTNTQTGQQPRAVIRLLGRLYNAGVVILGRGLERLGSC